MVAPFAGIITQRNIDIGSLISSGSSSTIPVVYHLAKLDRMRIFTDVPQADSQYVQVGQSCGVRVRELGDRDFKAVVTRFAESIDIASRTMRTEVQLPNPKGELLRECMPPSALTLCGTGPKSSFPQIPWLLLHRVTRSLCCAKEQPTFKTSASAPTTEQKSKSIRVSSRETGDELVENVTDNIHEVGKVRVAAVSKSVPQ